MALLGVYENEENRNFSVLKAVHFNLWIVEKRVPDILWDAICLNGLNFYKYFADVGLRFEVNEETVSEIDLRLPADGILLNSFCDLEEKVLDEDTNDLIFGRKVESRNNIISFSRGGRRSPRCRAWNSENR